MHGYFRSLASYFSNSITLKDMDFKILFYKFLIRKNILILTGAPASPVGPISPSAPGSPGYPLSPDGPRGPYGINYKLYCFVF